MDCLDRLSELAKKAKEDASMIGKIVSLIMNLDTGEYEMHIDGQLVGDLDGFSLYDHTYEGYSSDKETSIGLTLYRDNEQITYSKYGIATAALDTAEKKE